MGSVTRLITDLSNAPFPQLPVDWYVSPSQYALEQAYLFPLAPQYVGHTAMVPHPGDYYVIDWMYQANTLVNQAGNIALLSNICRHRQALMLTGAGNTQQIVCPLHRWTYDLNGQLLGAPHFDESPCLHLPRHTLTHWQGLLFAQSSMYGHIHLGAQAGGPPGKPVKSIGSSTVDIGKVLKDLGCKQDFDFTGYYFNRAVVDDYAFNWKTFIEVYLEDYHVGPFHPGLNQFVDCEALHWEFGEAYSVQTVGYKPQAPYALSPVYQAWQEAVSTYQQGTPPKYGAIWFVLYPFLMIEWYPNVLVVSHLIPTGPESCRNVVEFYYPEDIALFEQAYITAQQAAYFETAVEDKEICQRMHDGRKALMHVGRDERGPYQHPMETGLAHFHRWYRSQMEPHLPANALR